MPRGVAIPELPEQLFRAVERVLERDGPKGLSGRAITREAGVATGLLYNHFADLDELLAAFIVCRARRFVGRVRSLSSRVGTGTVAENLSEAATAIAPLLAMMFNLVASRPSLAERLRKAATSEGRSTLLEMEGAFAAYLDAEKDGGRVEPDADTQALSIALVGAVHHLLMTGRLGMLERIVATFAGPLDAGGAAG